MDSNTKLFIENFNISSAPCMVTLAGTTAISGATLFRHIYLKNSKNMEISKSMWTAYLNQVTLRILISLLRSFAEVLDLMPFSEVMVLSEVTIFKIYYIIFNIHSNNMIQRITPKLLISQN